MATIDEATTGGLPAPLARTTEVAFRAGARLRRARAFHPKGAVYPATATVESGAGEPGIPVGTHVALVRFSRGGGLPDALPDLHGIAVRLVDAHGPDRDQDLLLTTTGGSIVGRRLLRPGRSLTDGWYSSLLPFRTSGGRVLVGARFAAGVPSTSFGELDELVASGRCRFGLHVAAPTGPWRRVGTVAAVAAALPPDEAEALGFDPFHTATGFEPVGTLNRLRRPAYAGSRAGRPGGARRS